jgi:hypothetical protein
MPVSGGLETCVIDGFHPDLVGYWEVVENGIYFVEAETSPYPTLEFFAFATGRTSRVAMLAATSCHGPVA